MVYGYGLDQDDDVEKYGHLAGFIILLVLGVFFICVLIIYLGKRYLGKQDKKFEGLHCFNIIYHLISLIFPILGLVYYYDDTPIISSTIPSKIKAEKKKEDLAFDKFQIIIAVSGTIILLQLFSWCGFFYEKKKKKRKRKGS